MHHVLMIDFRGEKTAICYTGRPHASGGMEEMTFWFQDGRSPEDVTPEEGGAMCEAIERDARRREAADQPDGFDVKRIR